MVVNKTDLGFALIQFIVFWEKVYKKTTGLILNKKLCAMKAKGTRRENLYLVVGKGSPKEDTFNLRPQE